jgi:hypothetical protein
VIQKDAASRDAIEFVCTTNQVSQSPIVAIAPRHDQGFALYPAGCSTRDHNLGERNAFMVTARCANRHKSPPTEPTNQARGKVRRNSQSRESFVSNDSNVATWRNALLLRKCRKSDRGEKKQRRDRSVGGELSGGAWGAHRELLCC